jgi:dTDP-4-dehydrorhamnose 3,5-epimerase
MDNLSVKELPLAGLMLIERARIVDSRGSLSRLFCADALAVGGWHKPVSQINLTHTVSRGSIRGLHYQNPPYAEMKMVTCVRGEVWDVAVDLRANSSTFMQWHAQTLSAENGVSLLIPEGYAHGFQSMTDDAEIVYLHSAPYAPASAAALRFDDPAIGIRWPQPVTEISARDQTHPLLPPAFKGMII